MKLFYQCNRLQSCNKSSMCGKQCTHTTDKEYAFPRSERVIRLLEDGDFWEESPEIVQKVKDSGVHLRITEDQEDL